MSSAAPRRARRALTGSYLVELPTPVTARSGDSPLHHVRAALDLRLRAMLTHDPGTRSGADIEDLHQMRVSVRRMRATLKAARPLLDAEWADALRAELGWLGGSLGPVRDLDVMLLRLRGELATLPEIEREAGEVLVGALVRERVAARAEMMAALEAPRYTALLESLAEAIRAPLPARRGDGAQPELVDLVRTEARKLDKAVDKAVENPPDETLHALRILGKRLRYTAELTEPALGKPVTRLLKATAHLQEVLGDHQDACVAEERIRSLLDDLGEYPDAHVVFVAGRLVERERTRAEAKRGEWRDAYLTVKRRVADV
ncbi:CHAD domain-containing protein [Pseudonocardia asaccharolytica]|uniref:CHAD domain-containing protein n=1 Tax=Pseudonocardia asaccharolytica DSM 44247 = NBRC 16224 TaxID=1123024 RepID=A0A511D1A3_9PSEU|nr:CHAD domain-containing protein [Pseudonocardia asaccharolytica]GEL18572.1 CHAD domain-containing protein [Pseudonocardia asaccharolytica DSM 44247 = NBRC 16224]